jgi:hypothetical protein
MATLGWKTYMINACWDAFQFAFVAYFWIETKDLTLEEIDAKFEAITGGRRTVDFESAQTLHGIELDGKHDQFSITKLETAASTKRAS